GLRLRGSSSITSTCGAAAMAGFSYLVFLGNGCIWVSIKGAPVRYPAHMAEPSDDDAFVPELARSTSFRPIAHDLRSILAAALANVEYLRDHQEPGEGFAAAGVTVTELR